MPNKNQQIIDTLFPTKVMVQWKIAGCLERIGKVTIYYCRYTDTPNFQNHDCERKGKWSLSI